MTKANIKGSDVINICNYFEEEITTKKIDFWYDGNSTKPLDIIINNVLPNQNFILKVTYDNDGNITKIVINKNRSV